MHFYDIPVARSVVWRLAGGALRIFHFAGRLTGCVYSIVFFVFMAPPNIMAHPVE